MNIKDDYLQDVLQGKATLLFDGAMGTMLQAKEIDTNGQVGDFLCLNNPEAITDIHREYVEAGADAISTCSFNTSSLILSGLENPTELITAAVNCAKDAHPRYVAYDMGPLGDMLEPYGDIEEDDAYDIFALQAKVAEAAGADIISIETMMDLNEARIAVEAAADNSSLPVFATMSFAESGKTTFGVSPREAAVELTLAGANCVGANCGLAPEPLVDIAKEFCEALEDIMKSDEEAIDETSSESLLPVVLIQPNAGSPQYANGITCYDADPEQFAAVCKKMKIYGVKCFGSCCGTTPAFTSVLARYIK